LGQGVQGISDLITLPGLVNVDFADVRAIMTNAGSALMGIGTGVGENRAQAAARQATASPLLEVSIEGAKGVLFNIIGGSDMTMSEVDEAAKIISQAADADANIIFGATIDDQMVDQIKITVIATGFDETNRRLRDLTQPRLVTTQSQVQQTPSFTPTAPQEPNLPIDELGTDKFPPVEDEFDIPAFLRQGRN